MTATLPTQYPFPVAPGGLRMAAPFRSLRGPPNANVRQPDLGFPPSVGSVLGFGAGAGAMIIPNGSAADQSQGLVSIRCGLNPATTGVIQLNFPAGVATGQYWGAGDWATIFNVSVATPLLQFSWNATRTLLSNEVLLFAYQWTVST